MHSNSNKKGPKWLSLLFVASLLLNTQASVACAMMPDMSEQGAVCCCGVSHRSTGPTDLVNEQAAVDLTNDQHAQGPVCDDPRIGCCMLEVSVGINDPPSSDELLTLSSTKIEHGKFFNQLDDYSSVIEIHSTEAPVVTLKSGLSVNLPDSFLHQHVPPLYKTTERYRI